MQNDWNSFQQAAQRIAQQTGFPLAVLLSQAAVETGRNPNNAPGNNWFGIKGSGNAGSNNLATQEAGANGFYGTNSNFAAYKNPEDSIMDYINFIQQHFPQAMQYKNNPEAMVRAIAQGGYATDPNYAEKVLSTPEFRNNVNTQQPNIFQQVEDAIVPRAYAEESSTPLNAPNASTPNGPQYFSNAGVNSATQSQPSSNGYTVKPGDTLWDIAQAKLGAGNRYKELQGYSGDPRQLPIGTQLTIPNSSQQPAASMPRPVTPTPTPPPANHLIAPVYARTFGQPTPTPVQSAQMRSSSAPNPMARAVTNTGKAIVARAQNDFNPNLFAKQMSQQSIPLAPGNMTYGQVVNGIKQGVSKVGNAFQSGLQWLNSQGEI